MGMVTRTVEVDSDLLAEFEAGDGTNDLNALLQWALTRATSGDETAVLHPSPDAAESWARRNTAAISAYNAFIEAEGVFGDDLRLW